MNNPESLTLYLGNRLDGRFVLPMSEAVAKFKASEHYQSWQDGWPLSRAVATFVCCALNASFDTQGPEDIDRLCEAILQTER